MPSHHPMQQLTSNPSKRPDHKTTQCNEALPTTSQHAAWRPYVANHRSSSVPLGLPWYPSVPSVLLISLGPLVSPLVPRPKGDRLSSHAEYPDTSSTCLLRPANFRSLTKGNTTLPTAEDILHQSMVSRVDHADTYASQSRIIKC